MTNDGQTARSCRDLTVWEQAIEPVKTVCKITARFPTEEQPGLASPLRRAAVSIPSNIAEGLARKSTRKFVQLLSNAEGSPAELDAEMVLGSELGLVMGAEASPTAMQIDERRRMLNSLRRKLGAAPMQ